MHRYRDVAYDSSRWDGFNFRDGDIVISAPVKSGTTWLQTIVAMVVLETTTLPDSLSRLSPWLDMQTRSVDDVFGDLAAQGHRRFIKTHTPLDGLPFDERVTYVTIGRDPRDVAISFMYQMGNVDQAAFLAQREAAVGLDDMPDLLRPPAPPPSSVQEVYCRWFDFDDDSTTFGLQGIIRHLATFWSRRHDANIMMLRYSDLARDCATEAARLATRLGITIDEEIAIGIANATTLTSMRNNADRIAPNADQGLWRSNADFFRRGGHGEWREIWDGDTIRRYDERVAELADPTLMEWLQT